MWITLEEAKKHLNLDDTFNDDDNYVLYLIQVAEDTVEKHIDRDITEVCKVYEEPLNNVEDEDDDNNEEEVVINYILPQPLKHAMLLYIGNMYDNRESVSFGSPRDIPFSYEYLTQLYRKY